MEQTNLIDAVSLLASSELLKVRRKLSQNLLNNPSEFFLIRAESIPPVDFVLFLKDVWFYHVHLIWAARASKSICVMLRTSANDTQITLEIPWSSGLRRGFILRKYKLKPKVEETNG